MAVLITTTVSMDVTKNAAQAVIHLQQGDAGTRKLRLVPNNGGGSVDVSAAAAAKVKLHHADGDLLVNCEKGDTYADLVPTEAMVESEREYSCELVLTNAAGQTLSSAPFTIIVHASVYTGDAVEHTNSRVSEVYFDTDGKLCIKLLDGSIIKASKWEHTHANATTSAAGSMSADDKNALDLAASRMDQGVKTTDSPTFAGITIGTVTINGTTGVVSGMRFG